MLRPARAGERSELRRLLDQYLAELARYSEVDLIYPWFDAYWEPGTDRWAYVLQGASGELVGFALVNRHSPSGEPVDYAMAEFYVVPAERRSGTGRAAVAAVLHRHKGSWELSAMRANRPALQFWGPALVAAGVADLQVSEQEAATIFRFSFT